MSALGGHNGECLSGGIGSPKCVLHAKIAVNVVLGTYWQLWMSVLIGGLSDECLSGGSRRRVLQVKIAMMVVLWTH